jgi:hypothetical protein
MSVPERWVCFSDLLEKCKGAGIRSQTNSSADERPLIAGVW